MIVAGFGFRRSATLESLQSALESAGFSASPDALAAPGDKCGARCLRELSAVTGLDILPVSDAALRACTTTTQSPQSQRARATGSVAEAAALAAAGPGARLLGERQISQDRLATCAIATGASK